MNMSVGVLDHFNIRTRKLADTVRFYEDVLGLEKGARPNFAFPGAWMYSEGKPVVHLVDISKTDEPQKPDSGVVHHVAFVSQGFAGIECAGPCSGEGGARNRFRSGRGGGTINPAP